MKLTKTSGATLAAAAAAFIMAGTVAPVSAAEMAEKNVQCFGVNACKGQGACKTASNACKGQNSCKGTGFVSISAADCTAKGGSTTAPKAKSKM